MLIDDEWGKIKENQWQTRTNSETHLKTTQTMDIDDN